jgi:hypothetical protein
MEQTEHLPYVQEQPQAMLNYLLLGGTPSTNGNWSNVGLVYSYTVAATSPCTVVVATTVTVDKSP